MNQDLAPQRVVTIVDLQIQNILSVENAFRVVGAQVRVVQDAQGIADADLLVLPGVGSFGAAAQRLYGSGVAEAIRRHSVQYKRPVLGLCLGMQLLADTSEEHGLHNGLGLISGKVLRLQEAPPDYRVPNIGWRTVNLDAGAEPLLPRSLGGRSFYHVHSFHFETANLAHRVGLSQFGAAPIASIVRRDNVVGLQFHPEKSQEAGLDLLYALVNNLR